MATLVKTLKLQLGTDSYECQLNVAEVVDNPSTSDVETFCGKETFSTPGYQLHLGGFQDWTDANGICELIDDAYRSDPAQELDFEVALGEPASAWRSGTCKPSSAPAFGGTAGSPLAMDLTMDVVGAPDKTALTP